MNSFLVIKHGIYIVLNNESYLYDFFKFIYYIIIFGIILVFAYFFTKYIGVRGITSKSKNIKLLESLSLNIDKHLYLIKVGEQYFLLGSTKNELTKISEINSEFILDIDSSKTKDEDSKSFGDYFEDIEIMSSIDSNNTINARNKLKVLISKIRGNKKNE